MDRLPPSQQEGTAGDINFFNRSQIWNLMSEEEQDALIDELDSEGY